MGNMATLRQARPRPGHEDERDVWIAVDVNDILVIQDRFCIHGDRMTAYRADLGTVFVWPGRNHQQYDPRGQWLRVHDYYGRVILVYLTTRTRHNDDNLDQPLHDILHSVTQEQLSEELGGMPVQYRIRSAIAPTRITELGIFNNEEDMRATLVPNAIEEMVYNNHISDTPLLLAYLDSTDTDILEMPRPREIIERDPVGQGFHHAVGEDYVAPWHTWPGGPVGDTGRGDEFFPWFAYEAREHVLGYEHWGRRRANAIRDEIPRPAGGLGRLWNQLFPRGLDDRGRIGLADPPHGGQLIPRPLRYDFYPRFTWGSLSDISYPPSSTWSNPDRWVNKFLKSLYDDAVRHITQRTDEPVIQGLPWVDSVHSRAGIMWARHHFRGATFPFVPTLRNCLRPVGIWEGFYARTIGQLSNAETEEQAYIRLHAVQELYRQDGTGVHIPSLWTAQATLIWSEMRNLEDGDRIQLARYMPMRVRVWMAASMYKSRWENRCARESVMWSTFVEYDRTEAWHLKGEFKYCHRRWMAAATMTSPHETLLKWYPIAKPLHLLLRGIYSEAYRAGDYARIMEQQEQYDRAVHTFALDVSCAVACVCIPVRHMDLGPFGFTSHPTEVGVVTVDTHLVDHSWTRGPSNVHKVVSMLSYSSTDAPGNPTVWVVDQWRRGASPYLVDTKVGVGGIFIVSPLGIRSYDPMKLGIYCHSWQTELFDQRHARPLQAGRQRRTMEQIMEEYPEESGAIVSERCPFDRRTLARMCTVYAFAMDLHNLRFMFAQENTPTSEREVPDAFNPIVPRFASTMTWRPSMSTGKYDAYIKLIRLVGPGVAYKWYQQHWLADHPVVLREAVSSLTVVVTRYMPKGSAAFDGYAYDPLHRAHVGHPDRAHVGHPDQYVRTTTYDDPMTPLDPNLNADYPYHLEFDQVFCTSRHVAGVITELAEELRDYCLGSRYDPPSLGINELGSRYDPPSLGINEPGNNLEQRWIEHTNRWMGHMDMLERSPYRSDPEVISRAEVMDRLDFDNGRIYHPMPQQHSRKCDSCGRSLTHIRMQWTGRRMAPRGHAMCPCLTGVFCTAVCAKRNNDNNELHRRSDGHQRYRLVCILARTVLHLPGLEKKILRYLRVMSGYEYGMMPVYWEY